MNQTNSNDARLAWMLAWASVIIPLLCWSTSMFDETRFDGALFTLIAILPIGFSVYKKKFSLISGSGWIFAAGLAGCLPFIFNPEFDLSLAPAIQGLVDRAPLISAILLAGCMHQWQRENLYITMLPLFVAVALACWFCLPQALGWDPPGYLNLLGRRPLYPFIGLNHAGEIVTPILLLTITLGQKYCKSSWLGLAIPMALLSGFWGGNAIRLGLACGLLVLFFFNRVSIKPLAIITALFIIGEIARASTTGGFKSLESEYRSTEVRLEMYAAGINKASTTPLGIGLGQFEHSYPRWRASKEAQMTNASATNGAFRAPKSMHNDFLQAILELGWLGSAFLLIGLFKVWQRVQQTGREQLILYSGFAISFAICSFTRSPFSDNLPAMAIFMLVTASLAKPSHQYDNLAKKRLGIIGCGALCIISITPAYSNIRGESLIASAIDDPEHAFTYLSKASEARPWDSRNWVMIAAMYSISGQYEYARTTFDQALLYHPYDMSALLGAIKLEQLDPQGAMVRLMLHLETAEKLMPYHRDVVDLRIKLLTPQLEQAQQRAAQLSRQGNALSRRYWLAAELLKAHIALSKQDPIEIKRALFSAAQFSDGKRAKIERLAKKEELSRQLLTQLTFEVFPQWPTIN